MDKQWWHIAPPDNDVFDMMVRERLTSTMCSTTEIMRRMGAARLHWKALAAALAGTRKRNPSWAVTMKDNGAYGRPQYGWRLPPD